MLIGFHHVAMHPGKSEVVFKIELKHGNQDYNSPRRNRYKSQLGNKFIVAGNSLFYLKACALALAPRWLSRSLYLLCSSGAKPSPAGTISMQKCREPGEVMLQIPNKFHCKNCQARKSFFRAYEATFQSTPYTPHVTQVSNAPSSATAKIARLLVCMLIRDGSLLDSKLTYFHLDWFGAAKVRCNDVVR